MLMFLTLKFLCYFSCQEKHVSREDYTNNKSKSRTITNNISLSYQFFVMKNIQKITVFFVPTTLNDHLKDNHYNI